MGFNQSQIKQLKQNKTKKNKSKPGDKLEATVQKAVDDHLRRRGIKYLRFPDWFWSWVHVSSNATKIIKIRLGKSFGGWPDAICFYPVSGKYSLCLMDENKSKKGRFSSEKQKSMSEELNYQIPRSAEQGIAMIEEFIKDGEILKLLINKNIGMIPILMGNGSHKCPECETIGLCEGADYYCCYCGTKMLWRC